MDKLREEFLDFKLSPAHYWLEISKLKTLEGDVRFPTLLLTIPVSNADFQNIDDNEV